MPDTLVIPPKLKQILLDELDVTEDELLPDASFLNDLGCDSLSLYSLAVRLEEEYEVEIEDDEMEKARTLQLLVQLLEDKTGK